MSDSSPSLVKSAKNNECSSDVAISCPLLKEPFKKGWRREVVYRSIVDSGKRNMCDIYYFTPDGKKLRSRPDVAKYLSGSNSGFSIKNFSFFKEPIGMDNDQEICRLARIKSSSSFEGVGKQHKKRRDKKSCIQTNNSLKELGNNGRVATEVTRKRSREDKKEPSNSIYVENKNKRRVSMRKTLQKTKLYDTFSAINETLLEPPILHAARCDSPLSTKSDKDSASTCFVYNGENNTEFSDEDQEIEPPVLQSAQTVSSPTAVPFPENTSPNLNPSFIGLLPRGISHSTLWTTPLSSCTSSTSVKVIKNLHPELQVSNSSPSSVKNKIETGASKTYFTKPNVSKKIEIATLASSSSVNDRKLRSKGLATVTISAPKTSSSVDRFADPSISSNYINQGSIYHPTSLEPPILRAASCGSPLSTKSDDESNSFVHNGEDNTELSDEDQKIEPPILQLAETVSLPAAVPFPENLPPNLNPPLIGRLLPRGTSHSNLRKILSLEPPILLAASCGSCLSTKSDGEPCCSVRNGKDNTELSDEDQEIEPPILQSAQTVSLAATVPFPENLPPNLNPPLIRRLLPRGTSHSNRKTTPSCNSLTSVKEIQTLQPELISSPTSSAKNNVEAGASITSFTKPNVSKSIRMDTLPSSSSENDRKLRINKESTLPSSARNNVEAGASKTTFAKPILSKKIRTATLPSSSVHDKKLKRNKGLVNGTISVPKTSSSEDRFAAPSCSSDNINQGSIFEFGMAGNQNQSYEYWVSIGKALIEEGLQNAIQSNSSGTTENNLASPGLMNCKEFFALRKQKRKQRTSRHQVSAKSIEGISDVKKSNQYIVGKANHLQPARFKRMITYNVFTYNVNLPA